MLLTVKNGLQPVGVIICQTQKVVNRKGIIPYKAKDNFRFESFNLKVFIQ